MCGIAGFVNGGNESTLWQMLKNQIHRGPDDTGMYLDSESGVGLAHCRLAILDPSPLGHQPMESLDGSVILVFNIVSEQPPIVIAGGRGQGAGGSLETLEFQWFYLLFMS